MFSHSRAEIEGSEFFKHKRNIYRDKEVNVGV